MCEDVNASAATVGYRKLINRLRVSFADSSAMDPFIRQKAMNEAAEVINLLDRRARRFKALCDAQREMIAWYEDDHDIFEYEDEDLPGEVLEYRKALEAIEQEWEEDSEPI